MPDPHNIPARMLDGANASVAVARVGGRVRLDPAAPSRTARPVGPATVELVPAHAAELGAALIEAARPAASERAS